MRVFVYACVRVFIYACVCVFIYACVRVFVYACVHVFVYACVHVFVYACVCVCNNFFVLCLYVLFIGCGSNIRDNNGMMPQKCHHNVAKAMPLFQ